MSDAELVIRLLGDSTPEEQTAINTSVPQAATGLEPSQRPTTTTATETSTVSRTESGTEPEESRLANRAMQEAVTELRESINDLNSHLTPDLFDRPVSEFAKQLDRVLKDGNQPIPKTPRKPAKDSSEETTAADDRTPARRFLDAARNGWDNLERRSPLARRAANGMRRARAIGAKAGGVIRSVVAKAGRTKFGSAMKGMAQRAVGQAAAGTAASTAATGATTVAAAAGTAGAGGASAGGAAAAAALANPVGITVAAVVAGFAAAAIAATALARTFMSAADDIEQLSPDVALARDRQRMTTELNMLDRAQRIGPASGRLEEARGQLGNQMEKLTTDILETISRFEPQITAMINFAEAGIISLRMVPPAIDNAMAQLEALQAALTPDGGVDDAIAAQNIAVAKATLTVLGQEVADKITEAMNNLAGNNQQNVPAQIDPFLAAIFAGKRAGVP